MSFSALASLAAGILGAVIGWVALTFAGTPVRKFFDLRGEVIRRLTEFANVKARRKEVSDDADGSVEVERFDLSDKEIARLEQAQSVFRDLGSQMRSVAENEIMAVWILRVLRYDSLKASAGLIGLSNCFDTYGSNKRFQKKTIEAALRIKS